MSNLEFCDSHCHLNYDYAPLTHSDLVSQASELGIKNMVTVGVDIKTIHELETITQLYPNVYHTVGLHPHDTVDWKPEDADALRLATKNQKCRAIGEIGLDYYYDHSSPEIQKNILEAQLEIALDLNLPIVVHSRDAEDDLLPALTRYAKKAKTVETRGAVGAIHCFTGTKKFGHACLDLGFLISFSGILTFKNAQDLRESAREFPLDRLMVETDSPYLAPIPYRGKKCEPKMVIHTAEKLSEIKSVPLSEVAKYTTQNAKKFFNVR